MSLGAVSDLAIGDSFTSNTRLYYVVYYSAERTPSSLQIRLGLKADNQVAYAYGSETSSLTEDHLFAITSRLKSATSYKLSFVWSDGTNNSIVTTSDIFTTNAIPGTLVFKNTPWTRQPQGAVGIDRAHPSNRQTLILRDLSIARPGVTRTGTVVRPTPGGVALGFGTTKGAGASDSVAFPSMTFPSALTLIFTVSRNGAGGGGFGRLFEITGAGTWSITSAAGTLAFQAPWTGSPIWTTTASMPSTLTTVVLTYDGSSTANNPRIWWGGVERAFGAPSPAPNGSIISVTSALYIGNRSDGARAWDGEIGVFGLIGAAIAQSEAASISTNPWQLFAPIKQPSIALPRASTLPTLSSSTYKPGTLGTAGWQPRVTAQY